MLLLYKEIMDEEIDIKNFESSLILNINLNFNEEIDFILLLLTITEISDL